MAWMPSTHRRSEKWTSRLTPLFPPEYAEAFYQAIGPFEIWSPAVEEFSVGFRQNRYLMSLDLRICHAIP
jgi:hypothetical protein